MESIFDLFQKITSLHKELENLKPLKKEDQERLWKKFRLEWNYNSNHIEGNTLTYGQTELLLFFEKTTGDHDAREIDEMRGHDVALKMIVEYAKDKSREISEADIRELNKIILVRPFWSSAQTLDGQQTRKLIQPGEYKKEPNSVLLQSGEMFHYTSPEETPAKMKELMDWYRQAEVENKSHPVELAAKLHYDFVKIHPFDDSNGRTSRLLMNYVLLRHGYPPLIVKTTDKKGYLNALNQADVGNKSAYTKYMGEQMLWSLELSIKAARGENIEEQDDIDKEIEVWKKGIKNKEKESPVKSAEVVKDIYKTTISPLVREVFQRLKILDDIFAYRSMHIQFNLSGNTHTLVSQENITAIDCEKMELSFNTLVESQRSVPNFTQSTSLLTLSISFQGLKENLKESVNVSSFLGIGFNVYSYDIFESDPNVSIYKKLYSELLSDKEISVIAHRCLEVAFGKLKSITEQIRKR